MPDDSEDCGILSKIGIAGYYLSLASIFIRSAPAYHDDAAELIDMVAGLIDNEPEYSENHCYLYMVSA